MNIAFVGVLTVFQLLLVFLSYVIYKTLAAAFGITHSALLISLSFTFIVASILASRYKNRFVRWFHYLSMCWFAFIGPLFLGCIAFLLIEDATLFFHWPVIPAVAGRISFGGAIILYFYGLWKATDLEITKVKIAVPNLPEWWHGKKILFMSDIHLGNEHGARFAEKLVKEISSLKPQVVFIGGDLFDGVKCDPEKLLLPFRQLRPPYGVYFVSGNHEYFGDIKTFFRAIRAAGITILRSEKRIIEGIDFWGVDYKDTKKRKSFEKILSGIGIDPARLNVLIKHVPSDIDVAENAGISLQLSGHTHRGQIFPVSYVTHWVYKGYDYGLNQFEKILVYTSSGAAASSAPFRFGTKSEIALIEFE